MTKNGFSIFELIVIIVIISVISAFAVPGIARYLEKAQVMTDENNTQVLVDAIESGFTEGTLVLKNGRIHNTVTNRGYSGTGSWFREDMQDYIGSRVVPMVLDAQNEHNLDSGDGEYKYLFDVNGNTIDIFYYDEAKNKVVLKTIEV